MKMLERLALVTNSEPELRPLPRGSRFPGRLSHRRGGFSCPLLPPSHGNPVSPPASRETCVCMCVCVYGAAFYGIVTTGKPAGAGAGLGERFLGPKDHNVCRCGFSGVSPHTSTLPHLLRGSVRDQATPQ